MSRSVDYLDEMGPLAISDSDIERILRGQTPEGPGLSRLVGVIDELRAQANPSLQPETVANHVAMAAEAVREELASSSAAGLVEPKSAPKLPAKAPRWRLIPRLGTSLATLALLVGMTGVAVASDAAIPGEPLHQLDLALERIGIGAGGAQERIAEAKELAGGGKSAEALDHLSSSFTEHTEASEALREAANRLKVEPAEDTQSLTADEEVVAILEWMATADLQGEEFGRSVAERAQQLGDGNGQAGQDGRSNADRGNGSGNGRGNPGGGRGR